PAAGCRSLRVPVSDLPVRGARRPDGGDDAAGAAAACGQPVADAGRDLVAGDGDRRRPRLAPPPPDDPPGSLSGGPAAVGADQPEPARRPRCAGDPAQPTAG